MDTLLGTEDHRYSLKTLQALYYGATYGGVSAHGVLRIQFTDDNDTIGRFSEAIVLHVGPGGIGARTDDGQIKNHIMPRRILHAEVV